MDRHSRGHSGTALGLSNEAPRVASVALLPYIDAAAITCGKPGSQPTGVVAVEKWPIGVFASVDAGLGVKLEVARDLGVPTIQLHAPHQQSRTQAHADAFLKKIGSYGIRLTAVFGGFTGESYADIPTVSK